MCSFRANEVYEWRTNAPEDIEVAHAFLDLSKVHFHRVRDRSLESPDRPNTPLVSSITSSMRSSRTSSSSSPASKRVSFAHIDKPHPKNKTPHPLDTGISDKSTVTTNSVEVVDVWSCNWDYCGSVFPFERELASEWTQNAATTQPPCARGSLV